MKTMKIEKQLLFAEPVNKVLQLQVKEGLQYQRDVDGIRAIGPLYINGQFETAQGVVQDFQEVLDMDILAPSHKLNGEDFHIQVESFDGVPQQDMLNLMISMSIHGLVDSEETVSQQPVEEKEMIDPIIPLPVMESVEDVPVTEEVAKEAKVSSEAFEEFEDLFEDADTTYVSYRMIVAKPNDSYESIAQRYDTPVDVLKERNHHKEVQAKSLVILP